MLRVNTIYPAFMGEVNNWGIGVPCTFVRLAGCNLRCYLETKGKTCDTPEALDKNSGDIMSEEEILDICKSHGNEVICLTGGEPLCQDVYDFLHMASERGFKVVVETNGSRSIRPYLGIPNLSFVIDRKSSSSGELPKMREENYALMTSWDFLKFVIDTEEDYYEALDFCKKTGKTKYNVAFGLFWGSLLPYSWLMNRLKEDMVNAFLNMQTHKMCCLYDNAIYNYVNLDEVVIPKNL